MPETNVSGEETDKVAGVPEQRVIQDLAAKAKQMTRRTNFTACLEIERSDGVQATGRYRPQRP
jgi:hypothetical protein